MGGQPTPQQGRLLLAEEPAPLAQRLNQAVGAVGIDLVLVDSTYSNHALFLALPLTRRWDMR